MRELLKHFHELSLHPKNAKELKGLILQLAIQGKLTEEWRKLNLGIATNVQSISKEIDKSVLLIEKESTNLDGIKIPATWIKLKFKSFMDMQGGSQPPKSTFITEKREGYTRLFQIRDFGNRPNPVYVPTNKVSKFCSTEDIMIGRYGASIGKIFYGKEGAYNVALVRLLWSSAILSQDFVFYLFTSKYLQVFFQNCSRSAQAGFNKTDIGKLIIPIPPIEEQQEIKEVVETLFKEVEALKNLTEKRIELKKNYATSALNQLAKNDSKGEWQALKPHFQSFFDEVDNIKKLRGTILQLAVQGKLTVKWRAQNPQLISGANSAENLLKEIKAEKAKLVKAKKIKKEKALPPFSEDEIPYELPEGWVWCRFQSLFEELIYGTSKKCDYGLGDTPVLRIPNLVNGGIDLNDLKSTDLTEKEVAKLSLEEDDLLIIRSNGSLNLVGKSSIIDKKAVGFSYAGYLIRIRPFKSHLYSYFLHLVLESPFIRESIEVPIRSTSGVKNINTTEVSQLLFSLPSIEEQKVIVEKVNSLLALCDHLEYKINTGQQQIEALMQSVLNEVFEGEKEMEKVTTYN